MLKRKIWIGALAVTLLAGGTAVAASGVNADSKTKQGKSSYISEAQAKKAALKVAKGHVDDVDLEYKNGKAYYEVEIERSKGDVDVHVDAVTGKVLSVIDRDHDDDDRDKRKNVKYISKAQAKKAALKVANGHVDDVDLEYKNGKAYYEVEIERSKGDVDVHVDAVTGKVLSVIDRDHDDDDDRDVRKSVKSSHAKISSKQASDIAVKALGGGKVIKVELDEDDGRYIYEVEVRTSKGEADVDVDAKTGKVLSIDHDDHDDDDDDYDDDHDDDDDDDDRD
ncbi:PepSY domain-containing protein [Paenibacillus faecalis]|uniref:PepSY domain-containing protein n=1 Tax=Paenibacillus faecalis TaxID=2079532 RepID=UPI00131A4FC7|nr:PepSY domain-containing protein [Paenibacillus faecalis]